MARHARAATLVVKAKGRQSTVGARLRTPGLAATMRRQPDTPARAARRLSRQVGDEAAQRVLRMVQTKVVVGRANDPQEQDADRVAARVASGTAAAPAIQRLQRQEEEEPRPWRWADDEEPAQTLRRQSEEEQVQTLRRQAEEEPAQTLQRQEEEAQPLRRVDEEEPAQTLRRQTEEEPVQTVRRQAEEEPTRALRQSKEEEPVQAVRRQQEEESVRTLRRQVEEEPAQPLRRVEEEEPVQTLRRQTEEEPVQAVRRQTEEEPTRALRQNKEEEPVQAVRRQEEEQHAQALGRQEDGEPAQPLRRVEEEAPVKSLRRQAEEEPVQTVRRQVDEAQWPEPQEGEVEALEASGVQDNDLESEGNGAGGGGGVQALRRKEAGPEGGPISDPALSGRISGPGAGRALPEGMQKRLEPQLDTDFSAVRVHDTAQDQADVRALNARAFTRGSHVWLGRGESTSDTRLMAHELTHVKQQGGGAKRLNRSPGLMDAQPVRRGLLSWVKKGVKAVGGVIKKVGKGLLKLAGAGLKWLLGKLAKLARGIPGYHLLAVAIGHDPISGKRVARNAVNLVKGVLSLVPGGGPLFERLNRSGAIARAFAWFSKQISALNITWTGIKALFSRALKLLSPGDVLNPGGALRKLKSVFMPTLRRLWRFAKAVVGKIFEFIFEGVMTLAGPFGKRVVAIVRKAGKAFSKILSDPIGFLKNLIGAVMKGFTQFKTNILKHLQAGIMGWLFGTLSKAGIQLPEKFDLKGILSLVLQILGITYARIREKLVKHIGEKRVAFMEKAVAFLKIIVTEGVAGAWKKLVEYMGNLKEMVIGAIRDWVVTKIVKAAIAKIVSMFNPVGAIIQAIITIYNVVKWLIERMQQILALVESVVNSIAKIAQGQIGAAANYVEKTMARTLPVIISFLAGLAGLGGIADKIKGIIKQIQAKVDNAIDKVVGFLVRKAKALFGKGKGAVKKGVQKAKALLWPKKEFVTGGTTHKVYLEGDDANPLLKVASSPENYDKLLARAATGVSKLSVKSKKEKGQTLLKEAGKLNKEIKEIKVSRPKDERSAKLFPKVNAIAAVTKELGEAIGGGTPPSVIRYGSTSVKGGGTLADAEILSPSLPKGSEPQDRAEIWKQAQRRNKAGAAVYVQGHLLNQKLGGPGRAFNLTPLTGTGSAAYGIGKNANKIHEQEIESKIKSLVIDQKKTLRYKVMIKYGKRSEREATRQLRSIERAVTGTSAETAVREDIKLRQFEERHLATSLSYEAETIPGGEPLFEDRKDGKVEKVRGSIDLPLPGQSGPLPLKGVKKPHLQTNVATFAESADDSSPGGRKRLREKTKPSEVNAVLDQYGPQ